MTRKGLLAAVSALTLAGCATGPGRGFGEFAEVTLDLGFEPGEARDLGDGWFLTDLGYRTHLDRFELQASELLLEQFAGGTAGSFDPANPPEGYTLCHGGHCHAEDGGLHSYAEIEAELTGSGDAWSPLVAFDLDRELDLLGGEGSSWRAGEPSCEVPASHVERASLCVLAVSAVATIHDDEGTTEWVVTVAIEEAVTLTGDLDLPFDRDHDPVVLLDFDAAVDGTLLDGFDPAAELPGGGALGLEDTALVAAHLGATAIEATVQRHPY